MSKTNIIKTRDMLNEESVEIQSPPYLKFDNEIWLPLYIFD
jgi:hypothetical protein